MLNAITKLDNLFIKNEINWKEKDLEVTEDDDNGDPIEFIVYYMDFSWRNADLEQIKNKYNSSDGEYIISEIAIINYEISVKFIDKFFSKENTYLYI